MNSVRYYHKSSLAVMQNNLNYYWIIKKHEIPGRIIKVSEILNFMKSRVFVATLFYGTDRQTDSKQAGKYEVTNCRFRLTRISLGKATGKGKSNDTIGMC